MPTHSHISALERVAQVPFIVQDTLENLVGTSTAYVQLMAFWMPLAHAAQQGDTEQVHALSSAERYKPVLDNVFDFITPEIVQDAVAHLTDFTHLFPHPFTHAAFGGFDENVENGIAHSLATYTEAFTRFRNLLYTTGQTVMESMLQELIAANNNTTDNNAASNDGTTLYGSEATFFKTWIDRNEAGFAALFRTAEFIEIQNTLAVATAQAQKMIQNAMEKVIQSSPLATRSQMDALHKAVHDLKRDIRAAKQTH